MGFSKFKHVKVSGITAVVPEKVINIDDEIEFYDNDIKKLERNKSILGLGTRHVVDDGVTTVDLCEQAAKNLIAELKFDADKIEALIVVSVSHDFCYPASSCILQGRLKLPESCLCFDISGLACSGYVHGLLQAHALIESGVVKNCLLLTGDIASTFTDKKNRLSNMLFGDAATATLLEYSREAKESYFLTGTKGADWDKLIAPAGGRYFPIRKDIADIEVKDINGNVWHLWDDLMKGMSVFEFTMNVGPKSINELLEYAGRTIDDIDFFAIHQANKQIISTVGKHSHLPKEKYSSKTFSGYGNCASSSVTTVLCDQLTDKAINEIFLCTFGVGLSWGSCIINFDNVHNGGIKIFNSSCNIKSRKEKAEYWINYFLGEDNNGQGNISK